MCHLVRAKSVISLTSLCIPSFLATCYKKLVAALTKPRNEENRAPDSPTFQLPCVDIRDQTVMDVIGGFLKDRFAILRDDLRKNAVVLVCCLV